MIFLMLNPDETKLMISCHPKYRSQLANIKLQAGHYAKAQSTSVKNLGVGEPSIENIIGAPA